MFLQSHSWLGACLTCVVAVRPWEIVKLGPVGSEREVQTAREYLSRRQMFGNGSAARFVDPAEQTSRIHPEAGLTDPEVPDSVSLSSSIDKPDDPYDIGPLDKNIVGPDGPPVNTSISWKNKEYYLYNEIGCNHQFYYNDTSKWKGQCQDQTIGQSPIDINVSETVKNTVDIDWFMEPTNSTFLDAAHTVHMFAGKGVCHYDGKKYEYTHSDLHFPSEHRINGKQYAGEMHMYHQYIHSSGEEAKVLVISVLLDDNCKPDADEKKGEILCNADQFFDKKRIGGLSYWDLFEVERPSMLQGPLPCIPFPTRFIMSPLDLIPNPGSMADMGFYFYKGSLTQPPCMPGVFHAVLNVPAGLSRGHVDRLVGINGAHNSRPLQERKEWQMVMDVSQNKELDGWLERMMPSIKTEMGKPVVKPPTPTPTPATPTPIPTPPEATATPIFIMPEMPSPTPTEGPGECKKWCEKHPKPWSKKCEFKNCGGCEACKNLGPAQVERQHSLQALADAAAHREHFSLNEA